MKKETILFFFVRLKMKVRPKDIQRKGVSNT